MFESVIDLGDSHGGIGTGVKEFPNPVLSESLTHRHRPAVLDPGRGNPTSLVDDGNPAEVIPSYPASRHNRTMFSGRGRSESAGLLSARMTDLTCDMVTKVTEVG